MSLTGKVAGVDPEAFKIIDGKLYLNWNKEFADNFEADAASNVHKADATWEKLSEQR